MAQGPECGPNPMTEAKEHSSDQQKLHPDRDVQLEFYRQLMESQRDNTRIAYSWIGNVFLVLSSALIVFGLTTKDSRSFIPAMVLGIGLSIIWAFITEVFATYIRERFRQASQIESRLGFRGIAMAGDERFANLGWRMYFVQARTYVFLFVVLYIAVWILALVLKF